MKPKPHYEITYKKVLDVLMRYCGERGDNEGAIETLERIINERNILLRKAIVELFKNI